MPHAIVAELVDLLSLERLEPDVFIGQSRDIGTKYVFGGQVLGQALSAAQQTVESDRGVHSIHAYFLKAGDVDVPIRYQVERSRDGHSFSVRRVTAIQHDQIIFGLAASFQVAEQGANHQNPMPIVPPPEDVLEAEPYSEAVLAQVPVKLRRWLTHSGPFEFRPVYPRDEIKCPRLPPVQHIWFKLVDRIGDDPVMHQAMLAYASDYHLLGTATFPHGISYLQQNVVMASLDHALWFHRPFRVDEWLLYSCDSPNAHGGRGLTRGAIYNRDGLLIATAMQEGLIRVRPGADA